MNLATICHWLNVEHRIIMPCAVSLFLVAVENGILVVQAIDGSTGPDDVSSPFQSLGGCSIRM